MARRADVDASIQAAAGHYEVPTGPVPLSDEERAAFPDVTSKSGRQVMGKAIDLSRAAKLAPVQRMVDNIATHAQRGIDNGLLEAAKDYYPEQQRRASEIGVAFNDRRRERGLQPYHEDKPHMSGLLLSGGYSQNNTETNRLQMLDRSMATGDVQRHLSTARIEAAIRTGRHPIDTMGDLKLRDYTGSTAQPEDWEGEHDGIRMGHGYTIDRHQHDLAHNRPWGDADRGISGASKTMNVQRYRTHQAANLLAHQLVEQSNSGLVISRPAFQSLGWGGWRGGFD